MKLSFIKEKAIKKFSDKGLPREFIASRPILKEWLKGNSLERKELMTEEIGPSEKKEE